MSVFSPIQELITLTLNYASARPIARLLLFVLRTV